MRYTHILKFYTKSSNIGIRIFDTIENKGTWNEWLTYEELGVRWKTDNYRPSTIK